MSWRKKIVIRSYLPPAQWKATFQHRQSWGVPLVTVFAPRRGKEKKSMALIDMGNVKEERVAIHQVFLLRDTFPIIQSEGVGGWECGGVKDSDAQKHLRRKCSELNYGGGGRRRKQRNASRNKTDFPQGSPSLPPYTPLFVPERCE